MRLLVVVLLILLFVGGIMPWGTYPDYHGYGQGRLALAGIGIFALILVSWLIRA